MNLNKHLEFIEPTTYKKPIHVIGVGAVGSRIVELLVRLGFENIRIYDFDTVEDVNITNQLYTSMDIGVDKEDALIRHMMEINPKIKIKALGKYTDQTLSGAVFLAVDSIELRHKIVQDNMHNENIDIFLDGRMNLTDAQHFAANWSYQRQRTMFINTMKFKDDEVQTKMSVCGTSLSVATTVMTLASYTVSNFIRFLKNQPIANQIFLDTFMFEQENMVTADIL